MQYANESYTPSHSNNMASPTCTPLPILVLSQGALLHSTRKGLIFEHHSASVRFDKYVLQQLGEVVGVRVRARSSRRGSAVLAVHYTHVAELSAAPAMLFHSYDIHYHDAIDACNLS
jgi:hypothetical protein